MSTNRLGRVLSDIDAVNACDPNDNEVLYGLRMSETLAQFNSDASELLQIAVRAQHIERWVLPRSDFPEGRTGYKKWRSQLALHHANRTAELMHTCGYSDDEIERVSYLILKRGLKRDEETQCLEDVACIVFLKYYLEDFAGKHSEDKLINILQLTWGKMSEKGHKAALELPMSDEIRAIIEKALA